MDEPGKGGVTVPDFARRKKAGEPIVMVTAYDALFASLADAAGVDSILVGDSLATVLAGEDTTLSVTVERMIYHGRMVRRGAERALVVVDMPFLSYQVSPAQAVRNGGRILKETGAEAVKIEGGAAMAPAVEALVTAGIPVMGHVGFTPQSVHQLGGVRVRGRGEGAYRNLVRDVKALENAGAFAIVLAMVPAVIAKRLTEAAAVPTIGIGAGPPLRRPGHRPARPAGPEGGGESPLPEALRRDGGRGTVGGGCLRRRGAPGPLPRTGARAQAVGRCPAGDAMAGWASGRPAPPPPTPGGRYNG